MYRAIIVEDELNLRELLIIKIQEKFEGTIKVIAQAENTIDAVELINSLQPDIVFMDIQLRDGTGFDVLEKIKFKDFYLIFTTGYQEYAIKAFKYSAIDYLLKPLDNDELENAINKIKRRSAFFYHEDQLKVLSNSLSAKKTHERLLLPTYEGVYIVELNDIVRCETSGSYTTFHLADNKTITVSKQLKSYEEILCPPQFCRIHQSHLINLKFARKYLKEGIVIMKDKIELPIAHKRKSYFLMLLNNNF
jgi:two-component system LytT family response regulator